MVELRALFSAESMEHDLLTPLQIWDKCDDADEGPETPDPGALSKWSDIEEALAGNWEDVGDGAFDSDSD